MEVGDLSVSNKTKSHDVHLLRNHYHFKQVLCSVVKLIKPYLPFGEWNNLAYQWLNVQFSIAHHIKDNRIFTADCTGTDNLDLPGDHCLKRKRYFLCQIANLCYRSTISDNGDGCICSSFNSYRFEYSVDYNAVIELLAVHSQIGSGLHCGFLFFRVYVQGDDSSAAGRSENLDDELTDYSASDNRNVVIQFNWSKPHSISSNP